MKNYKRIRFIVFDSIVEIHACIGLAIGVCFSNKLDAIYISIGPFVITIK